MVNLRLEVVNLRATETQLTNEVKNLNNIIRSKDEIIEAKEEAIRFFNSRNIKMAYSSLIKNAFLLTIYFLCIVI